ncbi:MAG: Dps family protein [Snowella sp.]|nr:Dps family protein [Snowella sp.]
MINQQNTAVMPVNFGITQQDREQIADGLSRLLADTYTLYLKTHNFHWNVKGAMFYSLHMLFETQYQELAEAVDLIAERIRSLGFPAPGTYEAFMRLSSIPETPGVPSAQEMIRLLVEAQETVVHTIQSILPIAEQDDATVDLLTERLQIHEKSSWMLRSLLE